MTSTQWLTLGGGGPASTTIAGPPRCALASCLAELVGRFKRCSRCKLAHYCSGEHRPAHRDFCNAERARAAARGPAAAERAEVI